MTRITFLPPESVMSGYRGNSSIWTDERTDRLKTLWIEGKSASEIMRDLGQGVTRSAVIGKVHRIGLSKHGRAACAAPAPDVRKRTFEAPTVARSHVRPPHPGPQKKPALVLGATFIEGPDSDASRAVRRADGMDCLQRVESGAGVESPNARPFMEATSGCKWPVGSGLSMLYCCNPKAEGSRAYCAGHHAISISSHQPVLRPRDASRLTRFDRVERDGPRPAPAPRTLWDDARLEAA